MMFIPILLLIVANALQGCNSSLEKGVKAESSMDSSSNGAARYADFKNIVVGYLIKFQDAPPNLQIRSEFSSDFDKAYAVAVSDKQLRSMFFDSIAEIHSVLINDNYVGFQIFEDMKGITSGYRLQEIKSMLVLGFMTSIAILRNVFDLRKSASIDTNNSSQFRSLAIASFYSEMANRSFRNEFLRVLFRGWFPRLSTCRTMCGEKGAISGITEALVVVSSDKDVKSAVVDSSINPVDSDKQVCRWACVKSALSAYAISGLYYNVNTVETLLMNNNPINRLSEWIFAVPKKCDNDASLQNAVKQQMESVYKISTFFSSQFTSLQEIRNWAKQLSIDLESNLEISQDICVVRPAPKTIAPKNVDDSKTDDSGGTTGSDTVEAESPPAS